MIKETETLKKNLKGFCASTVWQICLWEGNMVMAMQTTLQMSLL